MAFRRSALPQIRLIRYRLALLTLLASIIGLPASAFAATPVTDDIAVNTVWTKAGSPYFVTRIVSVSAGVTLTVEAGVQVVFAEDTYVIVKGALDAAGTPGQPVIFARADPNKRWFGLSVIGTQGAPARATLTYTIVEQGGTPSTGNVNVFDGHITARNSIFRNSPGDGITGAARSGADLRDCTFTGNGGYAARFASVAAKPVLSRLTATGNGVDAIAIGGSDTTIVGEDVWEYSGVPYVATNGVSVPVGAALTLEPGVEVRFGEKTSAAVAGTFRAQGSAAHPITLTGLVKTPGYWFGLAVTGSAPTPAAAVLDYTTIEYAGFGSNGADLWAQHARVNFSHGILRHSLGAGARFGVGTTGSLIETSQITGNATFGITNQDLALRSLVLAPNNWWGSPSGPAVTGACNPGGTGDGVNGHVAFRPFLTSADANPGPLAPGEARILSVTPRRWFAPADGSTPMHVTMTLRDGNGRPVAGRKLRLDSQLGSVTDGGLTDPSGTTSAIVRSSTAGDSDLVPLLDAQDSCEYARGDAARVTFTSTADASPLTPDAEAPYVNSGIEITPLPIVRGVPTTLRIRLTNPNPFPIVVDATFGFAQAGIGLAFGPIGDVLGTRIEPQATAVVERVWTPTVSGHYCIDVTYTIRDGAAVTRAGARLAAGSSGSSRRNLNVYPGSAMPADTKSAIKKADAAGDALGDGVSIFQILWNLEEGIGALANVPVDFIQGQFIGNIIDAAYENFGAASCALAGGTQCGGWSGPHLQTPIADTVKSVGTLINDPPSQEFRTIVSIEPAPLPLLEPNAKMSEMRRLALNALATATIDMIAQSMGAALSFDRYAGAMEAGDLTWGSLQSVAQLHYLRRAGDAMVLVADRFDAFLDIVENEGDGGKIVTAAEYQAYQQHFATGLTASEAEAARWLGFDDAAIEIIRQGHLARDPNSVAGPVVPRFRNLAAAYRAAGQAILATPALLPIPVGGGSMTSANLTMDGLRAARAAAETNSVPLVRVFETVGTIQVGNPLAVRATIDLRARPLGLPLDWSVTIEPQQVTLDPGQQTTVTVTIRPGTSVPQGIRPRVAIEGYHGSNLIGGIALDVATPIHLSAGEDADGDGLTDAWEVQFGLDSASADGANGPLGDPDGDGVTNLEELQRGTHPRGFHHRYLAEGAVNAFFDARLALLNVGSAPTTMVVQLLQPGGTTASIVEQLAPGRRRTIGRDELTARLTSSDFSVVVESDQPVVLDRTMSWDASGYGSHVETGVSNPSTTWYFAEGSTSSFFSLFYLLQNPNPVAVTATVRYLRPFGLAPIVKSYALDPLSRTTIPVDEQGDDLANTDVSAVIETSAPIVAERAMYWSTPTQPFAAGHGSAGVIAPATHWFLAEGATGPFFDCFILLANPGAQAATVTAEYLLSNGTTQTATYAVPANGRVTIFADAQEIPEGSGVRPLENVAVSTSIASDVPIIVERTMWWPSPEITALFWTEAHNSPGATVTGTRWALAEGEVGGAQSAETYILLANTSAFDGSAQVTLYFEDGTSATRTIGLAAKSRTNVNVSGDFPEAAGKRFGAMIESLGATPAQIVVERAMYTSPGGVTWAAGTNALATRLQ
jgi:hypothetical protein